MVRTSFSKVISRIRIKKRGGFSQVVDLPFPMVL